MGRIRAAVVPESEYRSLVNATFTTQVYHEALLDEPVRGRGTITIRQVLDSLGLVVEELLEADDLTAVAIARRPNGKPFIQMGDYPLDALQRLATAATR